MIFSLLFNVLQEKDILSKIFKKTFSLLDGPRMYIHKIFMEIWNSQHWNTTRVFVSTLSCLLVFLTLMSLNVNYSFWEVSATPRLPCHCWLANSQCLSQHSSFWTGHFHVFDYNPTARINNILFIHYISVSGEF